MIFCPLISGSSGNATLVSHGRTTVLVDAGRSGVQIEDLIRIAGLEPKQLSMIVVTHEHADHVQGVGVLSRRYRIPVHATEGTWAALDRRKAVGRLSPEMRRVLTPGKPLDAGDLLIMPFEIPHDAAQPVGYRFLAGTQTAAVVATDLGEPTTIVESACVGVSVALVESNHDIAMLRDGPYPKELQERILSRYGHLCNETAGWLVALMLRHGARRLYLGHLSQENNHPAVALETVRRILRESGIDPTRHGNVCVADRHRCSEPMEL